MREGRTGQQTTACDPFQLCPPEGRDARSRFTTCSRAKKPRRLGRRATTLLCSRNLGHGRQSWLRIFEGSFKNLRDDGQKEGTASRDSAKLHKGRTYHGLETKTTQQRNRRHGLPLRGEGAGKQNNCQLGRRTLWRAWNRLATELLEERKAAGRAPHTSSPGGSFTIGLLCRTMDLTTTFSSAGKETKNCGRNRLGRVVLKSLPRTRKWHPSRASTYQ